MWRPRDRERFIGGYDPEHEMPDPDRDPGDRWQSGIYRHNARDGRYPYRWDPDRFEDRFRDRDRSRAEYDLRWSRDVRDRGYGGGYRSDSRYDTGPRFDRDRTWEADRGYDRGYDYDRGWRPSEDRGPRTEDWRGGGAYYEGDFGRYGSDYDRAREFGGRGYERDWRDRMHFDDRDRDSFDRQRFDRGDYDFDYDRWRRR